MILLMHQIHFYTNFLLSNFYKYFQRYYRKTIGRDYVYALRKCGPEQVSVRITFVDLARCQSIYYAMKHLSVGRINSQEFTVVFPEVAQNSRRRENGAMVRYKILERWLNILQPCNRSFALIHRCCNSRFIFFIFQC